ncbi:MAG: hypothetical protein AAFO59_03850 [Cyanobacteria bacterium J06607_17]
MSLKALLDDISDQSGYGLVSNAPDDSVLLLGKHDLARLTDCLKPAGLW